MTDDPEISDMDGVNLDKDLDARLGELIPNTEQVLALDPTPFGNDPFINELVMAADIDNNRKMRGSQAALLVYIAHSERLYQSEQHGLVGDRFVAFGKRVTGFGKTKVYKLHKLYPFSHLVLERCESDRAVAMSKNKPYEYPSWNRALGWFLPKPEKDDPAEDDEIAEPDDDDDGMAGAAPEPTEANTEQTIEIQANEIITKDSEIERLRARVAELEETAQRLQAELDSLKTHPAKTTKAKAPSKKATKPQSNQADGEQATQRDSDTFADPVSF